jgi:hypothetical protein
LVAGVALDVAEELAVLLVLEAVAAVAALELVRRLESKGVGLLVTLLIDIINLLLRFLPFTASARTRVT